MLFLNCCSHLFSAYAGYRQNLETEIGLKILTKDITGYLKNEKRKPIPSEANKSFVTVEQRSGKIDICIVVENYAPKNIMSDKTLAGFNDLRSSPNVVTKSWSYCFWKVKPLCYASAIIHIVNTNFFTSTAV